MTERTLAAIHKAYIKALELSTDSVTQITENFYYQLSTLSVDKKDKPQLDNLLLGVEKCRFEREMTFEVTNLCVEVLYTSMIIHVWMNTTQGHHLDVNYNGRRKSLESEFSKLLDKAKRNDYRPINDRFGIRAIIMDNDINALYCLSNTFLEILTRLNREKRANFQKWVETTQSIDEYSKNMVQKVLEYKFEPVEADRPKGTKEFIPSRYKDLDIPKKSGARYPKLVKDYIHTPKKNGYQSLHFLLRMSAFSSEFPGITIEFQFRTYKMHKHCIRGDANHTLYKLSKLKNSNNNCDLNVDSEKDSTFTIAEEEFEKLHLKGFLDYDPETDIDGVHFGKVFYNRRISPRIKLC